CLICNKSVPGPERQSYMGKDIYLKREGIRENNLLLQVGAEYPCGFCGRCTATSGCTISIAGGKAVSSCAEAYAFRICDAAKSSTSKPCTNVPIRCTLCNETHWKYNFPRHLEEKHP
ncbi:hypothetical protein R3P38DRAFT_2472931, partial [Favolaschia claudopus]